MQSQEIRQRFLKFFEKRGHKVIPSASLVPENDPSVLFNTAGMQPLVPYLLGQKHPLGNRIVDIQKCVRTGDLDDIGDKRHFSFFEMMGNWSLGDYFKEDAIKWSYEFLTSKEEGLGLDPKRLYITVFEGDENAPYDQESKDIWMNCGIPEDRIYALPADDNWWSPGDNGPCGPCSEMFYDMDSLFIGQEISKEKFIEECKKETIIEIWNDVFMEYEKKNGKVIGKLAKSNVDTGAGLERITAVMQGKKTAYDTDLLLDVTEFIKKESKVYDERRARILTDHIRTSVFMIADGVIPAPKNQGYVLRRLIRRAVLQIQKLEIPISYIQTCIDILINKYKGFYPELESSSAISSIFFDEVDKFKKTLDTGLKEFERNIDAFLLATTYGFPIELTLELAKEKGIKIDIDDFNNKMQEHQKLSTTSSAGMFKGGLANHNEKTIRLHTAHHLLLAALQAVVNPEIKQRGSNITEERLRIDFLCDHKLTDEEKIKVEEWVNEKINADLAVIRREMSLHDAEQIGAEMEFGAKYPQVVSVYFIEDENGNPVSKEFCGGPHVEHTSVLGTFKIQKEEAVASGIRRIKATLL